MVRKRRYPLAPKEPFASRSKQAKVLQPAKPSNQSDHKVTHLDNGLLSMEKTPEHLVDIVKRNAVESPLLRLPGEIRNLIWEFSCSNQRVKIAPTAHHGWKGYVTLKGATQKPSDDIAIGHSAFHLPEVCRQVYTETATLAYALSTFSFSSYSSIWDVYEPKNWATQLVSAQREAVTTTELEYRLFYSWQYVIDRIPPIKTYFPSLSRIYIPRQGMKLVKIFNRMRVDPDRTFISEQWEAWIEKKIKEREGDHVEVVFLDI